MSREKKQSSFWLKLLKVIAIIIFIIFVLILGVYLYLKYSLGIDVIDIKRKINLLNKPVVESEIITNSYTEDDAKNGFQIIFDNSNIYNDNGEGYSFNEEEFNNSSLKSLGEACLTAKEYAACTSVIIENINSNISSLEGDFMKFDLKQMAFSNLTTTEDGKQKVNVNAVFKIDFMSFKEEMNKESNPISNLLAGIVPAKIYFSSNVELTINQDNSYQLISTGIIINNLTLEQSNDILKMLEKLFEKGSDKNIVESISTTFIDSLFIGSDGNGLLKNIDGVDGFTFKTVGEEVCIVLLPEPPAEV